MQGADERRVLSCCTPRAVRLNRPTRSVGSLLPTPGWCISRPFRLGQSSPLALVPPRICRKSPGKFHMRKGPPASNSSRQRLNIRHVHRDAFRLLQPACLGRFRRTTTMGISFFSPRQTGFSKTPTARKRHGVAESNRCSGAVGRGGRLRAANACDHCGGRFGMVTHRCWGSKFCKKTCKASYLREFWGNEICRCFGFVRRVLALGFCPLSRRMLCSNFHGIVTHP